ncbi:MAG TPA: hypothetical protein DDX89_04655 [Candidatus Omnitrophica bacterium]|nr:hypothetical protein [Candidatus Rokubacteria bacterium]HBH97066.1 hypothetical protein [Candidatus Omnitrophota bacterium]
MTDNELAIAERLNEIERWWNGASLNADEAHRSTTAIQPTEIVNLCRELLAALAQERELKAKLDKLVCDTLATRVKCEKELENARERNASLLKLLVESVIPYEALLADAESRKWIAPSIWGAMEECRDKVRALIGVSPSSRDAQGERT